jgi:flagellar basal-body rod modification protein FlgD
MVNGLSPIPTKTDPNQQIQSDKSSLGKEDFMTLLVAQLQAQDPTNPMDAQDFSAQLAQFSTVEQMFNVNDNLVALQESQAALNNTSVLNLIGKTVNSSGNSFGYAEGAPVDLNYNIPANAEKVTIDIFNSSNQLVASADQLDVKAGESVFTWSGLDSKGDEVSAGDYTFKVTAENELGNTFFGETLSSGKVSQVIFEAGISYAVVNGEKISTNQITQVSGN